MPLFVNFMIIIACIAALWFGATLLVEGATRIARRLGISELVIGLTVVAMGTSAPEFAVTISSALKGHADISVSNVVGSNIFNLGFILGGVALVHAIKTSPKVVYRDGLVLIGATLLLVLFLRDFVLGRVEGLILMLCLVAYVSYLIYKREPSEEELPDGDFSFLDVGRLLAGIAIVLTGGHYLVDSAVTIAEYFQVPQWVIGVTIVAAGTSTPEMATSLVAVLRGHHGLSIGNLIGSDLFNMLGVLGLAAFMRTLSIDPAGYGSILMLSGLVIAIVIMMRIKWRISRWEGGLLILVNLIRWYFDFSGR